mmetsp:Transcript_62650/g.191658  ORF Transcript_62650/g.191658 Transcript_62650/m.191658 type:complete len:248 (-) Transcript_62650:95-838(-)
MGSSRIRPIDDATSPEMLWPCSSTSSNRSSAMTLACRRVSSLVSSLKCPVPDTCTPKCAWPLACRPCLPFDVSTQRSPPSADTSAMAMPLPSSHGRPPGDVVRSKCGATETTPSAKHMTVARQPKSAPHSKVQPLLSSLTSCHHPHILHTSRRSSSASSEPPAPATALPAAEYARSPQDWHSPLPRTVYSPAEQCMRRPEIATEICTGACCVQALLSRHHGYTGSVTPTPPGRASVPSKYTSGWIRG